MALVIKELQKVAPFGRIETQSPQSSRMRSSNH